MLICQMAYACPTGRVSLTPWPKLLTHHLPNLDLLLLKLTSDVSAEFN